MVAAVQGNLPPFTPLLSVSLMSLLSDVQFAALALDGAVREVQTAQVFRRSGVCPSVKQQAPHFNLLTYTMLFKYEDELGYPI